ncbi:MAG: CPBP family intramembrane metalloprotease [Chloroflexi bacterium]|nr:CPBP family intramembrane metalloprotease [Chloroflexota bacterium]
MSWGLIITVTIFGLTHIATTQSLYNAAYTGAIFLVLGLIYKSSRNAIGPMLAWTLINGQVWYLARLLS